MRIVDQPKRCVPNCILLCQILNILVAQVHKVSSRWEVCENTLATTLVAIKFCLCSLYCLIANFKKVVEHEEEVAVKKHFFLYKRKYKTAVHYLDDTTLSRFVYHAISVLHWSELHKYTERKYGMEWKYGIWDTASGIPELSLESKLSISSPSLWTFLRVTEGVEMAEARKLAGNVSEESAVTPRRSFSLNIFLHEGDRVNVLVPSCGDIKKKHWRSHQRAQTVYFRVLFIMHKWGLRK